MLLTITTHHAPATDLGFLLHKHPDRCQSFDLSFGQAHVFYPQSSETACTAALLLDIDPIALVRTRRGPAGEGGSLATYVNDRPYVASSFMSVAVAQVFGTALAGTCKARPQLVEQAMPLEASIAAILCAAGEGLIRDVLEPLGYQVTAERATLDPRFPEWGDSPYFRLGLQGTVRLCDLLSHLYVLMPVLDNDKHYWVGPDEVDKLLRQGEGWLAGHPRRDLIVNRYLKHQGYLTRAALERLTEEDQVDPDAASELHDRQELEAEQPLRLNEQRLNAVVAAIRSSSAKRILDLGCGEGRLLRALLREKQFEMIVGMDVSSRALEIAEKRLKLDKMPERQRTRVQLIHGSLMYRDVRLQGFDAATIVEVIEHLDGPRLRAFERVVFEFARPQRVVITTPNVEYNDLWPTLPAGQFRHRDHRFEWTRDQFLSWAERLASRFGYRASFAPVGPVDEQRGSPTQMALFDL